MIGEVDEITLSGGIAECPIEARQSLNSEGIPVEEFELLRRVCSLPNDYMSSARL